MTHGYSTPIRGGAWLTVDDDSRINYRVEDDGENLEVSFFGSMELAVGMSPGVARHCHDVLGQAVAEMERAQNAPDHPDHPNLTH